MFDTARIDRARIVRAITRKELAQAVGIHPYAYTRILRGETKNPRTVKAICDLLELSMEEVTLGGTERVA